MSFQGNLSPLKRNNRCNLMSLFQILNEIFLTLAVISLFIVQKFVYQPHILLPELVRAKTQFSQFSFFFLLVFVVINAHP